jgi:hypothetical protein
MWRVGRRTQYHEAKQNGKKGHKLERARVRAIMSQKFEKRFFKLKQTKRNKKFRETK